MTQWKDNIITGQVNLTEIFGTDLPKKRENYDFVLYLV